MEKIRLAIIDDQPIVVLGIKMAIQKYKQAHFEFSSSFDSGRAALAEIHNESFDVLLVDILLPDISGIDLIKGLLEINPNYRIGIYSSITEKEIILEAFDNGAMGFLSKSANSHDLVEFIMTIAKGEMYIRGEVAKIMVSQMKPEIKPQKYVQLTRKECDVFNLIICGLKTKEIALQLQISDRTVEFHKQNIYKKYGVSGAFNLAKIAVGFVKRTSYDFGNVINTEVPLF